MGNTDQTVMTRVATLTDRQRECLRLILKHYETKEIARFLGISPDRASKDIKSAMAKLNVSRRVDAARILAGAEGAHEGPGPVQALSEMVPMPPIIPLPIAETQREYVAEMRATYVVDQPPIEFSMPLRKPGSPHNDLRPWQRLVWIALITAFTLSAFGVLAGGLASLSTSVGATKH